MTIRSFPNLGFDPTPGDVDATRSLVRHLTNVSTELNSMVSDLRSVNTAGWKGKAAAAFESHVAQDVQPLVLKASNSFQEATSALGGWVGQMQSFQHEADDLEREAAAKKDDLDQAKSAVHTATSTASASASAHLSAGKAHAHAADLKAKNDALSDAGDALSAVRQRANDLHDRYIAAAGAVGRHFEKAGKIAPAKPGFFDRMADDIDQAWDDTTQWVKDHAELFKFIGDIASDLSAVFGVLAICTALIEPLGAIFAGLALATSAISLVSDLVAKAGGADVSWLSIGISALGVIPGIGVFAKGAKVAEGAEAVVKASAKAGELGEGVTSAAKSGTKIAAFGKGADVVKGGKSLTAFGKNVTLFGKTTKGIIKGAGIAGRSKVLATTYESGQKLGVAGLKMVSKGKVAIEAGSALGKTIDSSMKVVPKLFGVHGQVKDFHNMMDEFDHACTV